MSVIEAMMGDRPFTWAEMVCSLIVVFGYLAVFRSLKHREIETLIGGKHVKVERDKEPKDYWGLMTINVSVVTFFLLLLLFA